MLQKFSLAGGYVDMNICTFAGHSLVFSSVIKQRLDEEIENYLSNTEEALFYVGGRGEFDSIAAASVRNAKYRYRDKKIQLYLVEPYMRAGINRDKVEYERLYDGIIIPQELFGVHPKAAITKRNRWLVDQADSLIAFVQRDFGGAYQTLKYAERKRGIKIINIAVPK